MRLRTKQYIENYTGPLQDLVEYMSFAANDGFVPLLAIYQRRDGRLISVPVSIDNNEKPIVSLEGAVWEMEKTPYGLPLLIKPIKQCHTRGT